MIFAFLILSAVLSIVFAADLPLLNFEGFSWAENLAFDGLGNLFVTDAVRGELWRIYLSADGTKYDGEIYLHDGVKKFGGVQISPDGKQLYAGATFSDDSVGVATCSTTGANGAFTLAAKTETQPNGMAIDWERNILYYTQEGSATKSGTLVAVNLNTGSETVVHEVPGADGAWLDAANHKLYAGELTKMKIMVFDTTGVDVATFIGEYTGLSEALRPAVHMLDDLTLYTTGASNVGETMLLGADWTGKQVVLFRVDGGANVTVIEPPEGVKLYQPTSIRWGKGPGFDESSIYVTEGGGMTSRTTDRRVLQIKMK